MPNWLVHLAVAEILPKKKINYGFRYLLLGLVLPDFSRLSVVLIDFLHLKSIPFAFFEAFHTPFSMIIISISISLCTVRPFRVFWMVFGGCTLHFLCDFLEPRLGGGILFMYPFNYMEFGTNIFGEPVLWIRIAANLLSFCALIHIFFLARNEEKIPLRKKVEPLPIVLLLALAGLAAATIPAFVNNNVHSCRFVESPNEYEAKEIVLHVDRVISENPPEICARHDRIFQLNLERHFKVGDWISVRGTYNRGVIDVNEVFHDVTPIEKSLWSLPGMFFLFFIWGWGIFIG